MAATTTSSVDTRSQAFHREFENISREVQGSVEGNILPLGLTMKMPPRSSIFSSLDWNATRPQTQWQTSNPDWEKWLSRLEHFIDQQWKDQGIYHLIKLFESPIVMDQSLLVATCLRLWSSATNTMNLRFSMMTPIVQDMAALFGFNPIGVEVNTALTTPKTQGSFKAAWPTMVRLAARKVKNMLNYSNFYNSFCVEDDAKNGSYAPRRTRSNIRYGVMPWMRTAGLSGTITSRPWSYGQGSPTGCLGQCKLGSPSSQKEQGEKGPD
ncbi:unnamed protein product [Prunus brigantina]